MSDTDGFFGSLLSGLLGPSDDQLAALRQQYGIPDAEPVSPMVSMGRGAMDLWEPLKQMYLDATDPAQGTAYRQQRAEDQRLYQRGLLSTNPVPPDAPDWAHPDLWRQTGRVVAVAPLMLPGLSALAAGTLPEATMSMALTGNAFDALDALRKRLGILPDLQQ